MILDRNISFEIIIDKYIKCIHHFGFFARIMFVSYNNDPDIAEKSLKNQDSIEL